MEAISAEQGTFNPFISSNAATVPPFSFSLLFSLTLSFVKYQETISTDCTSQTSICSTCFSFCTQHEWMQNATGLTDATVLEWKQDLHSGASTGRKNGKKRVRERDIICIMLAIYMQCFLPSLFLACGKEEGFIQAMSWGKLRSSQKDALHLFHPRVFEEMDLWSALWIRHSFCSIGQEVTGLLASVLYD